MRKISFVLSICLIIIGFYRVSTKIYAIDPTTYRHELYIITSNGSGEDTWYNEAQSVVYESREFESIPQYGVTHEYDSGTLTVPGNQVFLDYKYGYDWNGVVDPQGVYEYIGHGFYKIRLERSGNDPYFYFDFRDADISVPESSTPDLWIYYDYNYQNKFVIYRKSDSTNYHEVVYTGETVSFWDVHNKSSVDQEPFEAIDDFDLKIFWYHDGYPYLIWNQTTPQGTLYKVYRKVGCFGQWEHIAGPSYRLYYRDHDVTKSGNTTIYYYIKETTNNKTTSTKSITGNYAPTDKEILINVVSLDQTLISSAYPNPFNPVTTISFYISESNQVKIEIYNISGKLIKTLYKGYKEAGNHEITWDATKYSAGVYFYKVRAGRLTEINKCLLMK